MPILIQGLISADRGNRARYYLKFPVPVLHRISWSRARAWPSGFQARTRSFTVATRCNHLKVPSTTPTVPRFGTGPWLFTQALDTLVARTRLSQATGCSSYPHQSAQQVSAPLFVKVLWWTLQDITLIFHTEFPIPRAPSLGQLVFCTSVLKQLDTL